MKNNQIKITKLDKEDLPLIMEMARDIIQNNYSAFLDKSIIDDFINSGLCDKEILDNMENCHVLKKDGFCIGFSILNDNKIHLMMIAREYQRQQYGTIFLDKMEKTLFSIYDEIDSKIELQSFAKNYVANNFYLKNAWEHFENKNIDGIDFFCYKKYRNAVKIMAQNC
jgi:GNAT superfamily N-acetyltransferase